MQERINVCFYDREDLASKISGFGGFQREVMCPCEDR